MFQALAGIVDALISVVNFIQSSVSTLLGVFELIPQGVSMISGLIQSLPPVLTAFATAGIAISVLFLVIGR